MNLRDLVIQSAEALPDALAINGPDTSLTYGELDDWAISHIELVISSVCSMMGTTSTLVVATNR